MDLGQGDNKCFSSFRVDHMTDNATFVARIRQVRDDMFSLFCYGVMLPPEMLDQAFEGWDAVIVVQFTFSVAIAPIVTSFYY